MNISIERDVVFVDKPANWTSFDVVAKLRGTLSRLHKEKTGEKRKVKVGHTGTLDPFATGLLVLAVGKATKEIEGMMKLDKVYEVEAVLGATSTTGDPEGEIRITSNSPNVQVEQVQEVIGMFIGVIEQIPPKYSAIKINGKRAYELARAGKEFEMKPRRVTINSIDQVSVEGDVLRFRAHVGSGTYIRTLVEDIGEALDCGAYTRNLRRTKVGDFDISDAISVDELNNLC